MTTDPALPTWTLPPNLATIVAEDGEWEDPSWDPLLLTIVGATRQDGRDIPLAWQLTLWPEDLPPGLRSQARSPTRKADGHGWADWIRTAVAARDPALASRLHDDSDAMTCVLWVEAEADGQAMMEVAWHSITAL